MCAMNLDDELLDEDEEQLEELEQHQVEIVDVKNLILFVYAIDVNNCVVKFDISDSVISSGINPLTCNFFEISGYINFT